MEELKSYGAAKLQKLVPPRVYGLIEASTSSRFDLSVRHYITLNCVDLYQEAAVGREVTERLLMHLFFPEDLENATIHNSFFLRFPDLYLLFPTRAILSGVIIFILCGKCH